MFSIFKTYFTLKKSGDRVNKEQNMSRSLTAHRIT